MRTQILQYCKHCKVCALQKVQKNAVWKADFQIWCTTMEFMSMDLVCEFHPPSSKGNRYALTTVCMLTGFTFCIPIKNKSVEEIMTAWRNHITFPFGVCRNYSQTMEQNLKMIYFLGLQKNSELKGKSINLHTDPNRMNALRDSTNSSKVVMQNTFLGTENGKMSYPSLQCHATGYQTSTQNNHRSSSCLVERHWQTCHTSPSSTSGIWVLNT